MCTPSHVQICVPAHVPVAEKSLEYLKLAKNYREVISCGVGSLFFGCLHASFVALVSLKTHKIGNSKKPVN